MVMYGTYNSDTLEICIDTVHRLHNQTTWNEKLLAAKIDDWYHVVLVGKRSRSLCNKFIAIPYHCKRKIH